MIKGISMNLWKVTLSQKNSVKKRWVTGGQCLREVEDIKLRKCLLLYPVQVWPWRHDPSLAMPYVIVRESLLCASSTVEGLPSNEARILAEKCCPEYKEEKQRRLDFNIPSLPILNSLEQLGYRVVSSGSFVASQVLFSTTFIFSTLMLNIIHPWPGKKQQICAEGIHLDSPQKLERYV